MRIKSVFENNGRIPSKYTCDGMNINPPLEFIGVPKNARFLVLIVDDPDSPSGIFNHWVLWNLSPDMRFIQENSVPKGAKEGRNDFGDVGYGGPCPHSGTHRYQFKLFALNIALSIDSGSSKREVEGAIEGHIIDKAILTGTYSRE